MTALRPAGRQSGFTLLEMLVTLVVLGLLVTGLARGVRTGLIFWDAQARRVSDTADLDAAARTLRRLLTGIPVLPASNAATLAPAAIAIKGGPATLAFTADLPNGFGTTRLADIVIELRERRLVLAWRPHRHEKTTGPPAAPADIALIADVDRLEFGYWGALEPGDAPAWLTQWNGPELPELIRVRLAFDKADRRRWPDLVAAPRLWAPAR